ncbi:MAG: response regulator [Candidatus Pacebacteria bacterium]|nr:response regulator [Candidatus Paceibacterota bacterium]
MKVLIIEEEEIVLNLLSKKLLEQGYEVKTARNGEDGMIIAKKEIPNVVLVDVNVAPKDGFTVIAEIKKNELLCNVPIIIIFNSNQPLEIKKAKELGFEDWVFKTEFNLQEIIQKIKQVLMKTSPQGEV